MSYVFVLMLAACGGSTKVEQSWKAPDAQANSIHKVATVYVSSDGETRRRLEGQLAMALNRKGVVAIPSYQVLSVDDRNDRATARAKLIANGFDTVVTMRLVSKETEHYNTFDDYWGGTYGGYYSSGYNGHNDYIQTTVRVETNVFSLHESRLVWSALSKTMNPDSAIDVVDDVTAMVVKDLKKHGVLVGAK